MSAPVVGTAWDVGGDWLSSPIAFGRAARRTPRSYARKWRPSSTPPRHGSISGSVVTDRRPVRPGDDKEAWRNAPRNLSAPRPPRLHSPHPSTMRTRGADRLPLGTGDAAPEEGAGLTRARR